ncbi:MAG TPA: MG2 domain-containing protein, partial [Pyrinomonadaceae bacterium]|nr:MG2 domain-containing protein [Pyrinomonadaceae bacterium]
MRRQNFLQAFACYLAIIALVFVFSVLRVRTQNRFAVETAPDSVPEYQTYVTQPDENAKPFFSLMTNRTYGTSDRTRVWVNYRGLDQLDFRVYRVKDPVKFFKQLANPHQVGQDEQGEVAASVKHKPTLLEKLRAFKSRIYKSIKDYVRAQLRRDSRKNFNQKFRRDDEDDTSNRTPLNVADYARVPLLNPDQMVSSWREKLPPLEDAYDRRMISLGRREPGVYLIEAVHGELRAYGVAIVTDLTMVQKTSRDGHLLVYAVDRKSGAPRDGVSVEVFKGKKTLNTGVTNQQGILQTKIEKPRAEETEEAAPSDQTGDEGSEDEEAPSESYLIMATAGENFAISDLDAFYFGGSEEGEGGDSDLTSYIYTDRPVYRPEQKVYFKGILRRLTEQGYRLLAGSTVSVLVEDPNGAQIFERELPLSSRGTFSGELDIPEEAPLGGYRLIAQADGATANSYFEVQEYKKPEFKARVTVPQQYVKAGEKTKFTVSARYFFGAPVTRADVKYYIYRSRYYPWWRSSTDESDDLGIVADSEDESSAGYGGYGDQMAQEGEGRLDAQGRLEVEFTVPLPDQKDTWDYTYRLEAQVTDASRRTMDAAASFVGIRSNTVASAYPERYVYYQGDSAKILVRAADHEGRPVATRVKLTFVERRWEKVTRRTESGDEYPDYDLHERELSNAIVETNAQGEASYDYTIQRPGSIHIKTTIEEDGRQVTSEGGSIWVADRNNQWSDVSFEGEGTIKLVPDKKSYRPGETAHVLALLPTDQAHLLVTTELIGVMSVRRIDAPGRAVVIDVPIEARFAPNIFLNVTYIKNSEMYTQDQMIVVPARDRLLKLQIIPNKKEYKPRETASYTVLARNADGSPASGAEVSLGVVDESIYSIAPEGVEDIRRAFYGQRYNQVQTNFAVNYHFTGYAGKKTINLAQHRKAYQLADLKSEGELVNPLIRKIFKDTAFWQPNVITGADGKAT